MTIALGFKSEGGIVLCTDSQITKEGGLKYNGQKIFSILDDRWAVAFAFAGSADLMSLIYQEMQARLENLEDDGQPIQAIVYQSLEEMMTEFSKKYRDKTAEFLCGISHDLYGRSLYRVSGKLVSDAQREYLGVGDSSVVRYLSEIFNRALHARQSLLLGSYIVAQANRYIDGCGGPLQAVVLNRGRLSDESDLANEFNPEKIEEPLRDLFVTLSASEKTPAEREQALQLFWKDIQGFDWTTGLRF